MNLFPIMLDLTGRLAVVVGYGAVGRRKAAGLQAAGAKLRIVTLTAGETLEGTVLVEPYQSQHLEGASLAFAAATPEVNARVVADARARGIWVNSATDPQAGDLMLPAVVRRGDLTLAVATDGAAPAASRLIREQLEQQFDAAWMDWLAIQRELRERIQRAISDSDRRREILQRLAEPRWLESIRTDGIAAVRQAMSRVVEDALRP